MSDYSFRLPPSALLFIGSTDLFSPLFKTMRNRKTLLFVVPPSLVVMLALIISTSGGHAAATKRAHVAILPTTDLHGHIDPIDYYTNRADNSGLAKAATIIKKARQTDPD